MPTIQDIAKAAGVSTRTVSRVLCGEPHVSAAVQSRVRAAIADLRYTPNIMARSMVTGRTGVLALSLLSITSPLVAALIKGALDRARQLGLQLILCETAQKRAEELEYLTLTRSGLVDGVILASHMVAPGVPVGVEELAAVCLVNYDLPGFPAPQFIQDCVADSYVLTRHLFEQGARCIAYLSGPEDRRSSHQKLEGFRLAHIDSGVHFTTDTVLFSDYTVEGGREAMSRLLRLFRPDAIFAGNDLIAIGAMQVAAENGIVIPDQLIICGFDDLPCSEYTNPPLTTIRPDMYGMGSMAVDALLTQLDNVKGAKGGTNPPPTQRVLAPGRLVVRASTCRAPRQ